MCHSSTRTDLAAAALAAALVACRATPCTGAWTENSASCQATRLLLRDDRLLQLHRSELPLAATLSQSAGDGLAGACVFPTTAPDAPVQATGQARRREHGRLVPHPRAGEGLRANLPPVCALEDPAEGDSFTAPASIVLTASASIRRCGGQGRVRNGGELLASDASGIFQ